MRKSKRPDEDPDDPFEELPILRIKVVPAVWWTCGFSVLYFGWQLVRVWLR